MINLPKDKVLHFIVGAAIVAISYPILGSCIALMLLFISAAGKELFDKYGQDEVFDCADMTVTIIGGVIVWGVILCL